MVLAANGPVFSAGHNFGDMAGADLDEARRLFEVCTEMMDTVQSIPQPVIARVHALATAAGCQLVATLRPRRSPPSPPAFAIPGGKGGLFCHTPLVAVARNIGRKRALEMALTGDPIDAATAADWGLINRVVPDDELDAAVADLHRPRHPRQRAVEGAGQAGFYAQVDLDQPAGLRVRRRADGRGGDDRPTPRRASPPSSRSATRTSPSAPDAVVLCQPQRRMFDVGADAHR